MGLFGKKKKPVGPGLDIPPAPPPVKATEGVVKAPAKALELPEIPTLPEIPPPEKLPTFEEALKKEEKAPPVREAVKKEVVPIEVPPPLKMEAPPLPKKVARPTPVGVEMPPPPGMEAPPPPMKRVQPAPVEIPPPPGRVMPKPKVPERLEVPPVAEEAPRPPSFEAVEEEISREERVAMGAPMEGPIFVRADNYKDVLDELNVARNIAKQSNEIFAGISDLSSISEQAYERWRLCLEDIERKMLYVDKSLFGRR